jgi:glutamate synthase domain-containing protein 2
MLAKDIYPDFITVDGAEGGTGAAPREFSNHIGTPLLEGLNFVNNTLLGFDLRKKIKVICSGKVFDGFTMINKFALGADICNSARGMMMSIGCIQALRCNSNNCPAGIATQDPRLYKLINVEDKSKRVARYHQETIKQMLHLVSAMGLENVEDIKKTHIKRRLGMGNIVSYADLYDSVEVGEFLDLEKTKPVYKQIYAEAQAERF